MSQSPLQSNPWFSFWGQPKTTIREIVHSNPKRGFFLLGCLYGLYTNLFFANWWSLGLLYPFYRIFFSAILLSLPVGILYIYIMGAILFSVGTLFKGCGSYGSVCATVAWSRIPYFIGLIIWLILMIEAPNTVFIQDGEKISSVFINFISLALGFWSFVFLVQTVKEVEGFGLGRAIVAILISGLIFYILFFVCFVIFRYITLASL